MKHFDPLDILLIEDNEGDIVLIEAAFDASHMSNRLHVARDGQEGLDFIFNRNQKSNNPVPSIILLDLNMPRINGREVLKEIKSNKDFCHIPVIVFTSSEMRIDIDQSYMLGANCYVVKPLDFDQFSIVINQIEKYWTNTANLPTRVAI